MLADRYREKTICREIVEFEHIPGNRGDHTGLGERRCLQPHGTAPGTGFTTRKLSANSGMINATSAAGASQSSGQS